MIVDIQFLEKVIGKDDAKRISEDYAHGKIKTVYDLISRYPDIYLPRLDK